MHNPVDKRKLDTQQQKQSQVPSETAPLTSHGISGSTSPRDTSSSAKHKRWRMSPLTHSGQQHLGTEAGHVCCRKRKLQANAPHREKRDPRTPREHSRPGRGEEAAQRGLFQEFKVGSAAHTQSVPFTTSRDRRKPGDYLGQG